VMPPFSTGAITLRSPIAGAMAPMASSKS
jgi:hypothetical protein